MNRQIGSFTVSAAGGRVAIDKRCMQADVPDSASAELLRDVVAEAMAIAHQAGFDAGHEAGRRAGFQEAGIVLASTQTTERPAQAAPPTPLPAAADGEGELH